MTSGGGLVGGYLSQPTPQIPKPTFLDRQRAKLVHGLLPDESWLTAWLKREPVRLIRTGGRTIWEDEDPLDASGRVRTVFGFQPDGERVDTLYRRLLSLMLAAVSVAYVVELAVGHIVAVAGKPLLDRGPGFASLLGVAIGALFAFIAILGRSSPGALTIGLVSGLSLDPTLALGSGLAFRLAHSGPQFAIGLLLLIVGSALDRRALGIFGGVALAFGVYLQAFSHLLAP